MVRYHQKPGVMAKQRMSHEHYCHSIGSPNLERFLVLNCALTEEWEEWEEWEKGMDVRF